MPLARLPLVKIRPPALLVTLTSLPAPPLLPPAPPTLEERGIGLRCAQADREAAVTAAAADRLGPGWPVALAGRPVCDRAGISDCDSPGIAAARAGAADAGVAGAAFDAEGTGRRKAAAAAAAADALRQDAKRIRRLWWR